MFLCIKVKSHVLHDYPNEKWYELSFQNVLPESWLSQLWEILDPPLSCDATYSLGFLVLIPSIVFRFRGSVSLDVVCTRTAAEFWLTRYILGNTGAICTKFLGNTSHQITVHLITIIHLMIKNHPKIMNHLMTSSHLVDQRITMHLLVRTYHLTTTDHPIKRNPVMWRPVVIYRLVPRR